MKVVRSLSPEQARVAGNTQDFTGRNLEQNTGQKGEPSCWWAEEEEDRRRRATDTEQTKLSSLGCCGVTLAFRTVQWSELVPLSYKRSNSNVPKEAVITISTTLLYSITSTYKLVNSHPPHTPNCPLSCMHFYSVTLKNTSRKKAENKSANLEQSLIFQIYFQSHYSAVTDDTLTSVC